MPKPGKDGGWPKFSPIAGRTSTHYVDPVVTRTCPYCASKYEWTLSQTAQGKERRCACGAVFSSWTWPQWRVP